MSVYRHQFTLGNPCFKNGCTLLQILKWQTGFLCITGIFGLNLDSTAGSLYRLNHNSLINNDLTHFRFTEISNTSNTASQFNMPAIKK